MRRGKRSISIRAARTAAVLLASFLMFGTCAASADSPIVFDDYVGETTAAQEAYSEPDYSETDAFEGAQDTGVSGASAETENNDGDDTYISNNGTVFRIPRVKDPSERVFDYRGIFTESQQQALREKIAALEAKKKCDIIILIPDSVPLDIRNGTETSQKYMRQFYIDNHFAEDGAGFLIDLDNRVLWTIGHGKYVTQKFVDFTQVVYEDTLSAAKRGDFYSAARVFLEDFDSFGNVAKAAVPTPFSLILSGFAALLGMLGFNAKHKHTQPSRSTTPPLAVQNYKVISHQENYLGTTVSRRRIVHRDNSGGGGGGFHGGFSSGGFSSGGGSFSGGGGKF